ncbi:MAG: flagellar biosynthesis anti-sigma factor FlgM [Treponema sp.]|nr:flagellar biosynthesis anti-sigma factor FlgM [Treponema sp.]MCI5666331.1 flagellar biosynthesis anti-sigma factor FlgM [Spirochaetia bacterium]MDD7769044.1 flagellar biosynthesis anti-sigma factor FlgM [Treponema sp.]MDY3132045.1 flagellar biosynthesis anti-sigma factor FlgM [Treponema sp.]
MMINGVNNVTQLNNVQNIRKTDNSAKVKAESDSISVSKEAVEMAEAYYMDKVAADTPDVRADRIAEVKAKIKDPSYLSNAIIQSTAEKLMTSYGL